jgi:glutaminyl-peptide cyclotransferase
VRARVSIVLAVVAVAAIAVAAVSRARSEKPQPAASVPKPSVDAFDAERAWRLVKLQLRYGQRPAGSTQLRRLARRLRTRMPNGVFERVRGRGLRNVVGTVPGRQPGVVIGAHYDTLRKPRGFVGANNGAAGSAIVLELARALAAAPRPAGAPELRFVLFDGEEPPKGTPEEDPNFYAHALRGSKAYVRAHRDRTAAMILLDYVGNRGLRLPREATSTRSLWTQVRAAATTAGVGRVFPDRAGPSIIDDHTPFLRAGVPAVDLIDWSYPGHSTSDRLDKLSRRSLDAVGETIYELVMHQPVGH